MISKALKIAYSAHQGQIDKGGVPYVQHPIRVALNCMTDDEKIVALLHDVIEDTNVTVEELQQAGFSTTIMNAIIALTRIDGEDYMQFIKRLSLNALATSVKIQDLKDNMDVRRLMAALIGKWRFTKKPYRSSKVLNSHHKRWRRLLRSRSDMYISIALIEQSNSMGESFNNKL